jgi:hypothetical protein
MIEKHLSVADSVVERKTIYRVARHHWPELLVSKNKNESRKINVLINRTEAILYGNQFVERLNMVDLNGVFAKTTDGTNKYIQTPVVAEKTVSTLVASLKSNRGQRVLSRSIPQESKIEEQLIVESSSPSLSTSINELIVDVLPSSLLSTSIEQLIVDTPSLPTINPPDDSATDPSLPIIYSDRDHDDSSRPLSTLETEMEIETEMIDADPPRLIVASSTTSPSIQLEPPPRKK